LKDRAAARAAAAEEASASFISPYNIRVAAGGAARGAGGLRVIAEDAGGVGRFSVATDDEEDDGSGEGEDERGDVLNRAELKKMSQKLMRYRRRLDHIPGLSPVLSAPPPSSAVGGLRSGVGSGDDGDGGGGGLDPGATRASTRRLLSRSRKRT